LNFSKALITGGAGFVGSHLAERLQKNGIEVRILDNLTSGFERNIPQGADFIKGDVRDRDLVQEAVKDVDVIFHLAEFIPNVAGHVIRFSADRPREDLDVCVGGTINVLEEARRNNAHFVLASTAAIYGWNQNLCQEDSVPRPISPYGVSKLSAEFYTQMFQRTYNLSITIFRFFNIFGPGQYKYLMYDFLNKLNRSEKTIEMHGDGQEVRDYIYIEDAIDLIFSTLDNRIEGRKPLPATPIFNIGTGRGLSSSEVIARILLALDVRRKIVYLGDSWPGNIRKIVADTSRTLNYVGSKEFRPFENSLRSLISWYNDNSPMDVKVPTSRSL
jgi:UDP-glucose 4-epimerase